MLGTVGLVLGLLAGERLPATGAVAVGLLFAALARLRRGRGSGRAAGALAILCLGAVLGLWRARAEGAEPRGLSQDVPVAIEGRISSHPERVEDRLRFTVAVRRIEQGARTWEGERAVRVHGPATVEGEALLGRRVRIRGYLRRSISSVGLRPAVRGPWWVSLESPRFVEVLEEQPRWAALGTRGRREVSDLLEAWPGPGGALARALVLGDRSRLPEAWVRASRATGSAHLLAVSGLHVALLAVVLHGLASPLSAGPVSRALRLALPAVGVVAYWLLVGPKPSVTRAAVMSLWALSSLALRRPPQALAILAGSAGLMLWAHPPWLEDLGFRLSFGATAALVLVTPWLVDRWSRKLRPGPVLRGILWSLGASVAAQAVTGPLLWPVTGLRHPLSPLLDLVAVPWLALLLALSWVGVLALGLVEALAPALLPGTSGILGILGELATLPAARGAAAAPGRFHGTPVGGFFGPWWGPVMLIAAIWMPGALRASRPRALALAGILCLGATWLGAVHPREDRDRLEVVFLDVGQGDAILLKSAETSILVDGGGRRRGDVAGRILVPALADLGVQRLDAVVVTHPDGDHCRGVAGLRSYLPVEEVWMSPGWTESDCVAEVLGRPGARWRPLHGGTTLVRGPFRIEALWPHPGDRREGNDRSLVLRVHAGERTFLLTGDLEAAGERALLRSGVDLRADFLKVGHHGSKTSTTGAFVDGVSPAVAVISAGRHNRYGHPHPSVTGRLEARGVRILRTDRHGTVRWVRRGRGAPWVLDLPSTPVPW